MSDVLYSANGAETLDDIARKYAIPAVNGSQLAYYNGFPELMPQYVSGVLPVNYEILIPSEWLASSTEVSDGYINPRSLSIEITGTGGKLQVPVTVTPKTPTDYSNFDSPWNYKPSGFSPLVWIGAGLLLFALLSSGKTSTKRKRRTGRRLSGKRR